MPILTDIGPTTTNDLITGPDLDTLADTVGAGGESPRTVQIVPAAGGWVEESNWTTVVQNTGWVMGGALDNTGEAGSYVVFPVVLAVGTWTLELLYKQDSDAGVVTVSLDDTDLDTVDVYGSSTPDSVATITGIASTTGEQQRLKFRVDSKNASSTAHRAKLQLVSMIRTA